MGQEQGINSVVKNNLSHNLLMQDMSLLYTILRTNNACYLTCLFRLLALYALALLAFPLGSHKQSFDSHEPTLEEHVSLT